MHPKQPNTDSRRCETNSQSDGVAVGVAFNVALDAHVDEAFIVAAVDFEAAISGYRFLRCKNVGSYSVMFKFGTICLFVHYKVWISFTLLGKESDSEVKLFEIKQVCIYLASRRQRPLDISISFHTHL